jgi:ATP-dependent Clp protease protease subunit
MIHSEIDANIKVRKIDDLYDNPVIVQVNKFTEDSAKQFLYDIQRAEQNKQSVIPVVIDSYGGQVYALLSMVDAIKRCKKPVATIAMGKAMSCGSILLSCGAEGMRYISPNATVMIHDVSSITMGKVEELKADANEASRLNKLVFEMMARNCGQDASYFLNLVHERGHADWYLTAEDCIAHKLVNHIRVPEFKVKVALDVQFK